MRIISQDGTIDVNYDLGNLSIARGADDSVTQRSIYFHSCSCTRSTKLATYSTDEKAQKAMEMLHEEYKKFQTTTTGIGYYNAFNYPRVFQFPTDSEIEVQQ